MTINQCYHDDINPGYPGYPGRRLGGSVLALDTRDRTDLEVSFTAGTVVPNSRRYNIRLQYRIGDDGPFKNLFDKHGNPVEYVRHDSTGHSEVFGPIGLPVEVENKAHIQLFWRYYFTGIRDDPDNGARSELNISKIHVRSRIVSVSSIRDSVYTNKEDKEKPLSLVLNQNYPNPFNASTVIEYALPVADNITIEVFTITGQRVATLVDGQLSPGNYRVSFDGSGMATGIYLYRIQSNEGIIYRKMMLIQ